MSLDETGFSETTFREYAYAPKGEGVAAKVPSNRYTSTTLIAARFDAGFRVPVLFEGSCDAIAFNTWLEKMLCPYSDVVLVEGVYTMRRELTDLYDLRIWVECPRAIRLTRGIARDGEKARSIWEHDWMPKEDRYVKTHLPHEKADLFVNGATSYFLVNQSS